jgi:tellurite resistance protein
MTPTELCIVKSLVAIAWADGKFAEPEQGMIDSLLWAFGASDEEEAELREYASKKRTLKDDVPLDELGAGDRELLLAHAALLTHADGKQTPAELKLLAALTEVLGFSEEQAAPIIDGARDRAAKLAEKLGA